MDKAVIFFDGVCNLCNKSVQFIIKRDKNDKFRYSSLQSNYGQEFLKNHGLPSKDFNSFILFQDNTVYTKSTGALKIISQLKGWGWTKGLLWFPRFIRDGVYRLIANNRYKWFGKREECMIPTKELQKKFFE